MIKNAIYKIREDHPSDHNILGYDKIIILEKRKWGEYERLLPADDHYDHERKVTYYEFEYVYECWSDGRRDVSSMLHEEFDDASMHCYDFVGFVGEE